MALETGTFINDLTVTNPAATDAKAQGDDHLRLIKNTLKNSLPGFTGVILGAGTEAEGASVNAFTVTLAPDPSAYTANTVVIFKSTHANTGAATLQINALGVKALQTPEGDALVAGNLPSGMTCAAVYDGTAFRLVYAVPTSTATDVQTFAASDTWTMPSGAVSVLVELLGAGGGGGSGAKAATSSIRFGGSGGGGGALHCATFPASVLGATETVTIGAGGAGGAAKTTNGIGADGTAGGASTFGLVLSAFGGNPGIGGKNNAATNLGGGGGGTGAAAVTSVGGLPGDGTEGVGGGGGGSSYMSEYGGAAGALVISTGVAGSGGDAVWGGAGGGAGGGYNASNVQQAAAAGGACNSQTGGSGAAINTAGIAVTGRIAGQGGGGGSGSTTTGTVGGAGYLGCGGGGGGGGTTGDSGAGGVGGAGYCRVTTYF